MKKDEFDHVDVDEVVKRHFVEAESTAPQFHQIWHAARASSRAADAKVRTSYRFANSYGWAMAVVVVVVAGWFVVSVDQLPLDETNTAKGQIKSETGSAPPIDDELLAHLTRSARWSAPSDKLLKVKKDKRYWGVPQIEWGSLPTPDRRKSDETGRRSHDV